MDSIYVVGAGGIGCAIGFTLLQSGLEVHFVDKNASKVQSGRESGIQVDGVSVQPTSFDRFAEWVPSNDSILFLCTKCYDNEEILQRLPTSVTLIPVQNGFDRQLESWDHDLEGIASFVSECDRDHPRTRITRKGVLHFGPRQGKATPLFQSFAEVLTEGGLFPVKRVDSIEPYKYTKLMYNAAISPIAAAAGIDNGKLLSFPQARRLFFDLLQENYRILSEAGIELGKIGPFHPRIVAGILKRRWLARMLSWAFEPSLRGTYCSMAPDLPRGKTEIDYYNQRLVELAQERPCPINRSVVRLIKKMESEGIPPHLGVLDELEKSLS